MTTTAMTAEDRLSDLGIHLSNAPAPFGAYVPAVQSGNLLFLSGMLATSGHAAKIAGIIGKTLDVKDGREAAHIAALTATRRSQSNDSAPRVSPPSGTAQATSLKRA